MTGSNGEPWLFQILYAGDITLWSTTANAWKMAIEIRDLPYITIEITIIMPHLVR